jgi:DNA-binding MarR family transcriptional regulator
MKPEKAVLAAEILQIVPAIMRTLAAELRRTGLLLTPGQFGVMVLLLEHGQNLTELAGSQAVSLPTMSNTIALLEQRGWVGRSRSPQDRRVVIVELTAEGRDVLARISRQAAAELERRMAGLRAADLRDLAAGLAVLSRMFALLDTRPADHFQELS